MEKQKTKYWVELRKICASTISADIVTALTNAETDLKTCTSRAEQSCLTWVENQIKLCGQHKFVFKTFEQGTNFYYVT